MNKEEFYSRLFDAMRNAAEHQVLMDHHDHSDIPDFDKKVERKFDVMTYALAEHAAKMA